MSSRILGFPMPAPLFPEFLRSRFILFNPDGAHMAVKAGQGKSSQKKSRLPRTGTDEPCLVGLMTSLLFEDVSRRQTGLARENPTQSEMQRNFGPVVV